MMAYKKILHFIFHKFHALKGRPNKGMTLLETLIALGLFAVMFVFISRAVQQSHRQTRKIKQDIQIASSLSQILDLIRRDLQGVAYLLDLNENLNIQFPIEQKEEDLPPDKEDISDSEKDLQNKDQRSTLPVLLNPNFIFEGENEEMNFVSYSFSNSALDKSSSQWIKVRYFIQDCPLLERDQKKSCLIRSISRYWNLIEDKGPEETSVLLRNFKSLKFFYSSTEDFLDNKWLEKWKLDNSLPIQVFSTAYPRKAPFPSVIKMELEQKDFEQTFFFPVSSFYLKSWNPYNKAYSGFPKWNPPPKKKKNQSKNQGTGQQGTGQQGTGQQGTGQQGTGQ